MAALATLCPAGGVEGPKMRPLANRDDSCMRLCARWTGAVPLALLFLQYHALHFCHQCLTTTDLSPITQHEG
ncbi:hypothetical protein I7I50_09850 [Histoplasma capsulatum G186AR]|uniref:Uncharacterized protein n=1 Tax=Ajellomyces capsulatus TaxID=5037 RepID=A0A8H8D3E2_AJECA|nr:hypothetical protein I7I52_10833 [Histoplasma capsulatum]QSS68770.1 hypothetical protein I7I50_09850 [Histoplasma capsulatum G186AR]